MLADPREQSVGSFLATAGPDGLRFQLDREKDPGTISELLSALAIGDGQAGAGEGCAASVAAHLGSTSIDVQREACFTLQGLGEAAGRHAGEVAKLLRSEEPAVRQAAAEALGSIGARGPGAAARLGLAGLLEDPHLPTRCAALRAVGSLEDASLLEEVAKHLSDKSPEVAAAACSSLGSMKTPLRGELVDAIGSKLGEGRTRAAALEALAGLGKAAAGGHCEGIVTHCLGDPDILTREQAILALGLLAEPESATERVVEQLKSEEASRRCAAALALGQMGAKALPRAEAVAELLTDEAEDNSVLALQTSGAFVRPPSYMRKPKCAALAALGMLGRAWAEEAQDSDEWELEGKVEGTLKDEDWEVRACALAALLQLGDKCKADADAVAGLLEDDTYLVRAGACAVLGALRAADKVDQLADLLADPAPSVRAAALRALAVLGEDAADVAPKVLARLGDHVDAVRAAAAQAVGGLGEYGRCFAGVLAGLLAEEPNAEVRREVLEALGGMGAHGAAFTEEVAECLQDDAAPVRAAAMGALRRLRA